MERLDGYNVGTTPIGGSHGCGDDGHEFVGRSPGRKRFAFVDINIEEPRDVFDLGLNLGMCRGKDSADDRDCHDEQGDQAENCEQSEPLTSEERLADFCQKKGCV